MELAGDGTYMHLQSQPFQLINIIDFEKVVRGLGEMFVKGTCCSNGSSVEES